MSPHVIGRLSLCLRNSTSQDVFAATGGALAAAAAVSSLLFASTLDEQRTDISAVMIAPLLHPTLSYANEESSFARISNKNILTNSQSTFCEAINNNNRNHQSAKKENVTSNQIIIECDYAVLGHGKAGQSAVRTLRKLDPNANVVIIDPNNNNNHYQNTTTTKRRGNINHLKTHASHIDHSNKLIRLHANPSPTAHGGNSNTTNPVVHFRKSALIATGSRGSPPPSECIHHGAWGRVLELRSTSLPPTQPNLMQHQHDSIPVLDPPTVRSLSLLAASQSATVAIMGSGFEALELAASLSRITQQQRSSKNDNNNNDGNNNKRVILLFGNAGPMSTRLPRYLSAAVSKRLRQCGIEVEERSVARYLSMESSSSSSSAAGAAPRLALYTEKSYDHLDSRRIATDLLVLAPNVDGTNGTSVIPILSSTSTTSYSQNHQHQYLPWSSLISPPLLTCYLDDGRVATNSEYQAASNIYAAGSVTRSPNPRNGRAEVGGGSSFCSARVGEIAARNMIRDHVSGSGRSSGSSDGFYAGVDESIPVWRSDVVPYLQRPYDNSTDESIEQTSNTVARSSDETATLALYSMGIHALCVGRCDCETLATHGFWWTNTNQQSNNNDDRNSNINNSSSSTRGRRMNTVGPNAFMRRITRKATSTVNGSKSRGGSGSLPVYGSGVVYYLDRTGSICGIMLWGLPFSQLPRDVKSDINNLIVERMKEVIRSNGAVSIQDHSNKIADEHAGLNVDLNLLSYLHLVEESKLLASMALSGLKPKDSVKIDVLVKPLHRYTPIKSHELSSLGKLRRREMGYIAEEDDLFYPVVTTSATTDEESTRPPSLKRIYPMHGGATTTNAEKEIELQQLQIDRSRPPKEEPLWMRQGEEQRFVNKRDAMDYNFYRNIQQGKFNDGTDAVKQAPVPQAYLEAKEQLKSWTGTASLSREAGEGEDSGSE